MQIEYTRDAVKHIKSLDKPTRNRILSAIEKIPLGDIKKLVGLENDFRLRVGGYRILFSRSDNIIIIKDVLPRGQAYKRL